jgi:hypothetical protein
MAARSNSVAEIELIESSSGGSHADRSEMGVGEGCVRERSRVGSFRGSLSREVLEGFSKDVREVVRGGKLCGLSNEFLAGISKVESTDAGASAAGLAGSGGAGDWKEE